VICGGHKDTAYVNNTHCLQELKDNIQREMANISRQELCIMVTSKLWTINHCDVSTALGQVW
jgi:hypothetical protein